jgi:GTPase SAR1 family protein
MLTPILSLTLSTITVYYFQIKRVQSDIYDHLLGPQVLNKQSKTEGAKGLNLHSSMFLPMLRELQNIFVFGMQGSGKSNFIKKLLLQIFNRQDKALIYDLKGEYTELFFNENACLISPYDRRSAKWDLYKDIIDSGAAEVFAESVLPEGVSDDSFWIDSARTVLKGVLVGLNKQHQVWGWSELNTILFSPDEHLHEWLKKNYVQAAQLIQPGDKTTASIRSTLASQLGWVGDLAELWKDAEESFSLQSWADGASNPMVLIQGSMNAPIMSAALITSITSVATSIVLMKPDSKTERIWLVLDELGNLNKSQSLVKWLSLGRSKGCRTIAGTQLLSQIQAIYGDKIAETILGLFGNIIVLKLGPTGNSADLASKALGERRVKFTTTSINEKGEKTHSEQQETMRVVQCEDIIHLPQPSITKGVHGFLLVAGYGAVYKVRWAINDKIPMIAPARINKADAKTCPINSNRLNRRRSS